MLTKGQIVRALVVEQSIAAANPCGCYTCDRSPAPRSRMYVCATCGNKRCPRATDHRNECHGSNAPGQEGSVYE